ncbi:MAG: Asp23/Gls24 family envelope stress response protein [Candidatus Dormibacter sp.]
MSDVVETMEIGGANDERNSIGVTRVANDVVAWIAALTALQVSGVHAMYRPSGQSIDRILRRRLAHRGARVELRDDGLRIDLWIVMEAGANVAAVGAEVQRAVGDAIRRMLGMPLAAVNVFVSEVVFT